MALKVSETRFRIFAGILVGVFVILTGRLWFLQITKGEENLAKSNRVRTYIVPIKAPRGIMFDRNGTELVASRLAHAVSVVPEVISEHPGIIPHLAGILGMSEDALSKDVETKTKNRWRKPNEPIRIAKDIPSDIAMRIEEARMDLPGVEVTREPVRDYIYGSLGAHMVGYISEINKEELDSLKDQGYSQGDNIGKTGLERTYEKLLRGKDGSTQMEVDKVGRVLEVLQEVYPTPGHNLHLTIDMELQRATEKALADQLEHIRKNTKYKKANAGSVVVMDPRNGDILAMVSYPDYDPNLFVGTMSVEVSQKLFNDPYHPFTNRAMLGQYAPGSTFKPITVAAALETGKASSHDVFTCTGVDAISNKKCWVHSSATGRHGKENLIDGLKNSCNIVMYDLARRVGVDTLAKYSRMFGLGRPSGLDLYPGEKDGLVPDPDYKAKRFKGDLAIWRPNETLDFSIGQGFLLTTPIQLAQMYSAIANGGTLYQPRLVTAITSPGGEKYKDFRVSATDEFKLKPETMDIITKGLTRVASAGTAASVFRNFPLDQYPVAAKTGTAEVTGSDTNALFAAYAPADNPTIVIIVVIEQGGSGSSSAGPVAAKVLEHYFKIEPEPQKAAVKSTSPTTVQAQTPTAVGGPAAPSAPVAPAAPAVPASSTGPSEAATPTGDVIFLAPPPEEPDFSPPAE